MKNATIYFQLHQPFRLHPDRNKFHWPEKDESVFRQFAEERYLPTLQLLTDLAKNLGFRFALGMSRSFLDLAEKYEPRVIENLRVLHDMYANGEGVEFLDETSYNSVAGFFSDPGLREFREQVSDQRARLREIFGASPNPTTFRHTARQYSDRIASAVEEMRFKTMLADVLDNGEPFDPHKVYLPSNGNLIVIPRDIELSRAISYGSSNEPSTVDDYIGRMVTVNGDNVMLGFSVETVGDRRLDSFWREFAEKLSDSPHLKLLTPKEIAEAYTGRELPRLHKPQYTLKDLETSADIIHDSNGLLQNTAQVTLLRRVEELENVARQAGRDIFFQWRHLTALDAYSDLNDSSDQSPSHTRTYSPAVASQVLTDKVTQFGDLATHQFQILKRAQRYALLIVTPEIAELTEMMGPHAKLTRAQSGGQGLMLANLVEGLCKRENDMPFNVHLAVLNLIARFQSESGKYGQEWIDAIYSSHPDRIHKVRFHGSHTLLDAYKGDQALTAAQFQSAVANDIITELYQLHGGRLIVHTNDAMAGGVVNAKANERGIPNLHTSHNIHNIDIPLSHYVGLNPAVVTRLINSDGIVSSHPTAIKNCWLWNTVSRRFLWEIANNVFPDIVYPSFCTEVRAKYGCGSADGILNGLSPLTYPENNDYLKNPADYYKPQARELVTSFGPEGDILGAKKRNKVAFQRETGLIEDENAVLITLCARADRYQKCIDFTEEKAQALVNYFRRRGVHVQFAILSTGVEGTKEVEEGILRDIALVSGGDIVYYPYIGNNHLEALAVAGSDLEVGTSRYEPCGQDQMRALINGTFGIYSDVGGYHETISELRTGVLNGATRDHGNGFLFRHDKEEYWRALVRGVETICDLRKYPEILRDNIQRIMLDARDQFSLDTMTAQYIGLYERLAKLHQAVAK